MTIPFCREDSLDEIVNLVLLKSRKQTVSQRNGDEAISRNSITPRDRAFHVLKRVLRHPCTNHKPAAPESSTTQTLEVKIQDSWGFRGQRCGSGGSPLYFARLFTLLNCKNYHQETASRTPQNGERHYKSQHSNKAPTIKPLSTTNTSAHSTLENRDIISQNRLTRSHLSGRDQEGGYYQIHCAKTPNQDLHIQHSTMHPSQLLTLLLLPFAIATIPFSPDYSPHADVLSSSDDASELEERQIAAGGGAAATTLAATQYPTTSVAGSLFTVDGTTSATWTLITQTFATTALGTWALGPTPGVGTIGLGSIQGTVGKVKSKRAIETAVPVLEREAGIVPGEMEGSF